MTFETFMELARQNRSYRRFDTAHAIDKKQLDRLVELTRYCASAANMQPLKFITCCDREKNDEIFSTLGFAAYLTDWKGPEEKERPSAYIVVLADHHVADKFWCDHGIAAQTILLGARAMGLGGCMFGAVNIKKLKQYLDIAEHLEVKLVIALGKPAETIQIDDLGEDGNIKYWRDENQVHHVPKRKLSDLIVASWQP